MYINILVNASNTSNFFMYQNLKIQIISYKYIFEN